MRDEGWWWDVPQDHILIPEFDELIALFQSLCARDKNRRTRKHDVEVSSSRNSGRQSG